MKTHLWIVRAMSRLVPKRQRSGWKLEWDAELLHHEFQGRGDLLRRSLGAFWDALAMQPRRMEEEVFQDVRFGFRMFLKNKALTSVAILSLALGIGANTALFSLVDAALLKKLPVKNPDELVLFEWTAPKDQAGLNLNSMVFDATYTNPKTGLETNQTFSDHTFREFRDRNRTLSNAFAFARLYRVQMTADNQVDIAIGQMVSGGYFAGLGAGVALGRPITDVDDEPAAAPAAVISYRYWQRRFSQDPGIIGKPIKINDAPFTIVGVTSQDFNGTLQVGDSPDISIPISFQPAVTQDRVNFTLLSKPDAWWVWIMGRVKPGITAEQVRADLEGVFLETALDRSKPLSRDTKEPPVRLGVVSGSRGLSDSRSDYSKPLMILTVIAGLILLIACANVANLLLARATARQKEIAVRLTLGAGRLRLVRQLLTESLLLAMCGGVSAMALAYFTKDLLLRWGPWAKAETVLSLQLDLRVLAFTAVVSVLAGILFGIAPAFVSTRRTLDASRRATTRTLTAGRSRASKLLLVSQVGVSIVLLIAAGLFVQSLNNLHGTVAGLTPETLLQFDLDPSLTRTDAAKAVLLTDQLVATLQGIPGVRSVAISTGDGGLGFKDPATGRQFRASFLMVDERFFETMGVRLLAGRGFTAADNTSSQRVVIVNEAFVHRYFPDVSALGQTPYGVIIGVVANTRLGPRLRQQPGPAIYVSFRQSGVAGRVSARRITFRVRTNVDPLSIVPLVRDSVQQVNPLWPVSNVTTLAQQVDEALSQENMFASLSSFFGALALLLTAAGFCGLMAYRVSRRTGEIGVRMALGAKPLDVLRLVMSEGLILVIGGVGLGIAGAFVSTRYIESILFGLRPDDGLTITAAVFLMIGVAAAATFIPARKASRVDPIVALRYE